MIKLIKIFNFVIIFAIFNPLGFAEQTISFTDVSSQAGINKITLTYGASFTDVNNDGLLDIFVTNRTATPSLYINNGNGTFTDKILSSGLKTEGDQHGAAWGDYNNDGLKDLFISCGGMFGQAEGEANQFYKNLGNTSFLEITEIAGVADPQGRGRQAAWMDFDNDGDLDLFVVYGAREETPNRLFRNEGNDIFTEIGEIAGFADNTHSSGLCIADYNNDELMDVLVATGPVKLYRNNGNGTFTNVANISGLKIWGKDWIWGDYDNDGDLDLYVTRHPIGDDLIWDNSTIKFKFADPSEGGIDFFTSGNEVTFTLHKQTGKIYVGASRIEVTSPFTITEGGELNPYGEPEYDCSIEYGYFIWKDEDDEEWHIRMCQKFAPFTGIITTNGTFSEVRTINFSKWDVRDNRLFENLGNGSFIDVTNLVGLTNNDSSSEAVWADFDNDGDLDLFVNNGGIISNEPNRLYRNNGDKTFTDISKEAGVFVNYEGIGDSVIVGDYDNDGFLDIFLTNGRETPPFCYGPHILLRNNGNSNHWLKIKLIGTISNKDAIGAKVTLRIGDKIQYREQNGGIHGHSQNSQILHFGLGQSILIDSLTIKWPSGIVQKLFNIPVNQTLTIMENCCKADFDQDGDVDGTDLTIFVSSFPSVKGDPNYNKQCDYNEDDTIDNLDLFTFVSEYGKTDCHGIDK